MRFPFLLLLCLMISMQGVLMMAQNGSRPIRETGHRFVSNYSPEEYNAQAQNWSMIQDQRGLIYVANRGGVLEYDGVRWRKIQLPNLGGAFSLAVDEDNRIYVGGVGEMGYLKPDSVGALSFFSLLNILPDSLRDFPRIIAISALGENIFFRAPFHIFQIDRISLQLKKIWDAPGRIFHQRIGEDLVMWRGGKEWGKVSGDSLIPFGGGVELWAQFPSIVAYPPGRQNSDSLLLLQESGEVQIFDGTNISPFSMDVEVNNYLSQRVLYDAFPLGEEGYLIQTVPSGGLIIDQAGRLLDPLDNASGLQNLLMYDAILDQRDQLWLATDYGISKVEAFSPFSFFGEEESLDGGITSIVRHQGSLYVGTVTGLFRLLPPASSSDIPQFEKIEGFGAPWSMHSDGQSLLLGAFGGVFELVNEQVNPIHTRSDPAYCMYASPFDPSIVYLGYGNGLAVIKKDNGRWRWMGMVDGISEWVRSIVETRPGELWLGTDVDGILRFVVSEEGKNLIQRGKTDILISGTKSTFQTSHGIPPGFVNVNVLDNRLVITTQKGLKKLDAQSESFMPETAFGEEMADTNMFVFRIVQDLNGRITSLFDYRNQTPGRRNEAGVLSPKQEGGYQLELKEFNRLPVPIMANLQVLYPDPDQPDILWMGGSQGLIRYDIKQEQALSPDFLVYIRAVKTAEDSLLYHGNTALLMPIDIGFENNSLRFEFAAVFLQSEQETHYQIYLEGNDKGWSNWTKETYIDYTNLSEGTYQFRVRARNVSFQISESEPFEFVILPPWYRSWWAYLLYAILVVLLIAGIVRLYSRYKLQQLEARNRELEQTVAIRTEEIRVKNLELEQSNDELGKTLDTLKTTQDQLIIQEKMASLGQMTAGIAHEIKNPLNFINNFSKVGMEMADEFKEDFEAYQASQDPQDLKILLETIETFKKQSQQIHKHGERATEIVRGMMDHAKDKEGRRISIQLNLLVEDAIQLAYQAYQAKHEHFSMEIRRELSPDLPPIEVNPQDIRRVIINLVNNACYAMDQKAQHMGAEFSPVLLVHTEQKNEDIQIRIKDNGIGIPQQTKDHIFQPFFTTKPTGKGNVGLGLSISYDLITQGYQGSLRCESKQGEYTSFEIVLPLHQ